MLNPFRETLPRAVRDAHDQSTPFRAEADAALAGFRATRADLERQVRRGDLTVKVARERAVEAASALKTYLTSRSDGYSPTPRAFLDRLIEATTARSKAKESLSLEGLQRETNRLLRLHLMEMQITTRAAEFEGKTYVRSMTGGVPTPTLDGLLAFHRMADESGDEVAREWARRQLEGSRSRAFNDDDIRKIDLACDRPDRINPRLIDAYVDSLQGRTTEELEAFVDRATGDRDANGCIAAFVMARQDPEGARMKWVRKVLLGLAEFPDPALASLRILEAEARASEAQSAQAEAQFAIARAEAEGRLDGIEPPSNRELEQIAKMEARPIASPGESIGLALERRGSFEGEQVAVGGHWPEASPLY